MLQIRVHYHNVVRSGMLQPRVHRSLLAEIPRKRNILYVVKTGGKPLHYQISFVLAAVVYKDISEAVSGQRVDDLVGLGDKMLQSFLLVVAGNDQIDSFHVITPVIK